jgi:transglutaminase-like putative cysteine protease
MHTIGTNENLKFKIQKSKSQFKIKNFKFLILILTFTFYILNLLCGCIQKNDLELAQEDVGKSQVYYQHAIERYKSLISKGEDLDRLNFELGRLYFGHGEFDKAVQELKKTNYIQAKKLMAISFYHMGNFTDALEIFNKNGITDDEFIYYHGLTCEKLNLFDEALKNYYRIKGDRFLPKAKERIDIIERQAAAINIKDKDPKIYHILANAPQKEQYPQAGALILYCDEKIEIKSDDTQVMDLHYLIKILNERGKEEFPETQVSYDSTYEKVELEYARTIKPDGTVVEVGSRHIRDVSRYLNFPLYSNARAYIISFPEVTEGASIEYRLKLYRNKLINKKDTVISYPLQDQEPVIQANLEVVIPKDRQLNIKIINDKYNEFKAKLSPDTREENSRLFYRWEFKDIPQIIPETSMPPTVEINPTILMSTFNNWKDIYNWWWELSRDKIKADEAIVAKVKELTKGESSPEEKIRAIYNFCAQEIRYVAVEYGQAGYEPHYASDIYKNKYGDCKDQAILLVTMLREAGQTAWPVLIATRGYYNLNQDFPAVLFDHCIACVDLDDKIIFLDPTAQTCSFQDLPTADQQRRVLIVMESGLKILDTPMYTASHNLVKQRLGLKINKDESIQAEKSVFTFGLYDQAQRYWLLYTQPELIEQALKEKIQEVSIGAQLNNYKIENLKDLNSAVVLSYEFQGPEYFTAAGNLRIMPQLTSLDTSLVAKDKRKYDLDFGLLDSKETILEIEIPGSLAIKYIPDSLSEDSPWLKFVLEYTYKNNRIYFKQKTELKQYKVSVSEYPDFKKFFERIAKKIKQRVVLEKKK